MLWSACGDGQQTDAPRYMPVRKTVNLVFSVGIADDGSDVASRALTETGDRDYFEREATRYEKIHTLRIIILRPEEVIDEDGKYVPTGNKEVEYNSFYELASDGTNFYDDLTFEVIGNENKRIYIIANEKGVNVNRQTNINFDSIAIPGKRYTPGTIESIQINAAADGLVWDNSSLVPTQSHHYIPMAEVYDDIYVVEPLHEYYHQKVGPFFITRASVKFSFSIVAEGPENSFTLKKIHFNSLANTEYLLPNHTVYETTKDIETGLPNYTGAPDKDLEGRVITSFDVPADVKYKDFTFDLATPVSITKTPQTFTPLLYFCEGKLGAPVGPSSGADGTALMPPETAQPYSVGITVGYTTTDNEGKTVEEEYTYSAKPLDNLPFLPRNTHVKVNLKLTKTDITAEVDVLPYTCIELTPGFGF